MDETTRVQNLLMWLRKHKRSKKIEKELEYIRMLKRWFNALDNDGSGDISDEELGWPLAAIGVVEDRKELRRLISRYDSRSVFESAPHPPNGMVN